MDNNSINDYIDSLHFRTYDKVYNHVKSRFPKIDDKQLRRLIATRLHDKRPPKYVQQIYQVKIFSRFRNAWFTDLMDNGENHEPRYWQIFINTNTRYAVAYPLQDKNATSINKNLKSFVEEFKPHKITSDEEKGFTAKTNMDYLMQNKCGVYIVQEQLHSTLGIIDRFIRTLRDMNTPQEKPTTDDSTDEQFKYISIDKMKQLLNSYNNTYHSSIKMTPKQMMNDSKLEDEYIYKCLEHVDKQSRIRNMKLKVGDYVRYLIANDKFKKKRYTTSRECFKIDQVLGNMYTIIAQDGTTITLPRWRLFKVNDMNENKRFGKTLGSDKGVIDRVVDRIGNKFVVEFNYPDGTKRQTNINVSELRMPFPQIPSKYE